MFRSYPSTKRGRLSAAALFLLFILLATPFLGAGAEIAPTADFYVNDYADILSPETRAYIVEKSAALQKVDGTQLVFVSVPDLGGEGIEDYATSLFRSFGIGDAQKNNGLLILVAVEERLIRVEIGYGLEGILPDGKTGRIQDECIIPYLRENDWDGGIKNGYDAFYAEIVEGRGLDLAFDAPTNRAATADAEDEDIHGLPGFSYVLMILVGAVTAIFLSRVKSSCLVSILYAAAIIALVTLASGAIASLAMANLMGYGISALVMRFINRVRSVNSADDGTASTGGGSSTTRSSSYPRTRSYSRSSSSYRSSSSRSSGGYRGGGGRSGGGGSTRGF